MFILKYFFLKTISYFIKTLGVFNFRVYNKNTFVFKQKEFLLSQYRVVRACLSCTNFCSIVFCVAAFNETLLTVVKVCKESVLMCLKYFYKLKTYSIYSGLNERLLFFLIGSTYTSTRYFIVANEERKNNKLLVFLLERLFFFYFL